MSRFPRLDQLIASLGYGSRREATRWIQEGRVECEGAEVTPESRLDPSRVRFDGEALDHPQGLLVLLHKPVGYACTHDESEGPTVYDLLPARWNLRSPQVVSVGRLDKDTSGLLLLTDRHELVHRWTSPKRHVEKIYEVGLARPVEATAIAAFASGELKLRGEPKPCLPAKLEILEPLRARVTLREGRYHQVRRMFAAVGSSVETLHRSRFGEWTLEGVATGAHRLLPIETIPIGG